MKYIKIIMEQLVDNIPTHTPIVMTGANHQVKRKVLKKSLIAQFRSLENLLRIQNYVEEIQQRKQHNIT